MVVQAGGRWHCGGGGSGAVVAAATAVVAAAAAVAAAAVVVVVVVVAAAAAAAVVVQGWCVAPTTCGPLSLHPLVQWKVCSIAISPVGSQG